MATEVRFHFDAEALQEAVQQAAEAAIQAGVQYTFANLARRIPANRVKTRRYLRMKVEQLLGEVGVQFPPGSRYDVNGTETERILENAWRVIEPVAMRVVEEAFTRKLKEFIQ